MSVQYTVHTRDEVECSKCKARTQPRSQGLLCWHVLRLFASLFLKLIGLFSTLDK